MITRLCAVVAIFSHIATAQYSPVPTYGYTSERIARLLAIRSAEPVYPSEASAAHITGVAVCELSIDTSGHSTTIHILESPSESIAAAVLKAAHQWVFKPRLNKEPDILLVKLTFYFEQVGTTYEVLDPHNAGYTGPHGRRETQRTSVLHKEVSH
jgi:TonB family protein